jgi:alcohol dehydrogenase
MTSFDARPSPHLIFGPGRLSALPEAVAASGASKVLLVTDAGIVAAGHVGRAVGFLSAAGIEVTVYEGSHTNPSESDIDACRAFAAELQPQAIIGLGGGSSMDTAKGCNFLLHNPGRMADYRGYGLATRPMLPFIAIPTTAGTGSECQSFAVVSRDESHEKMACGDPKALARVAILDPELTASQPRAVAALTALDALSHALESAVCTKRNPVSAAYSLESFRLIASAIRPVLAGHADLETRGRMLLGAAMAGSAIENSMLGAAHASANPLTARFDLAHGHAVALMLPHVVRLNAAGDAAAASIYATLGSLLDVPLTRWLEETIAMAGLADPDIPAAAIPGLAAAATEQWTGRFNPVTLDADGFAAIYQNAIQPTQLAAS